MVGIYNTIINFGNNFIKGSLVVKVSYLIMGFACLVYGQILKGILFFISQIAFVVYIINFARFYLKDISTLGTTMESEYFDEAMGIMCYHPADNSMLILLYSVMSLIIILLFITLYFYSTKISFETEQIKKTGKSPLSTLATLKMLTNEHYHITLLSLPIIMISLFIITPLIFMILIAFTNYDAKHQPPGNLFTWVGFQNFRDILGNNPIKTKTFFYLFVWNITWAFFSTFSNYFLGIILALLINKKGIRGKKIWRTIFVITIAVPQFVSLLLMSKMFADSGPINILLQNAGMSPVDFFTNGKIARIMIILINIWVGIPYSMLATTGILMNIPAELYESAKIDGAGPIVAFRKITFPYILFVTTPYLITQFVGNFNNFNVIYLLTQGGPNSVWLYQAGETDLLVTWLYKLTVNFSDYNLASVIGILCFIISAGLSLSVYNMSGSVKKEEEFQ